MEAFLVMNGYELSASTDEQVNIVLKVASGEMSRERFNEWLKVHVVEHK
jgi:death-on-curing protein